MKYLVTLSIVLLSITSACKSAPEGFCDCLKKGEALDVTTQEVLTGEASKDTKRKMLELRKVKKKACAKFETSSGPQMREWREACD